jgi:hypothetical protein
VSVHEGRLIERVGGWKYKPLEDTHLEPNGFEDAAGQYWPHYRVPFRAACTPSSLVSIPPGPSMSFFSRKRNTSQAAATAIPANVTVTQTPSQALAQTRENGERNAVAVASQQQNRDQ